MATAILTAPTGTATFPESLAASLVAPRESDAGSLYEVVDGQFVEKPPRATNSTHLNSEFTIAVGGYAKRHKLGWAESEMLYLLDPATKLKRRLDFSFVSYERWPKATPLPDDNAWNVIPDLAVEVVSPTNLAEEVRRKIDEYFAGGVRLVWVVYPGALLVEVYESRTQVTILDPSETLGGGDVLPGFQLPLGELFEGMTVKTPETSDE